MVRPGIFFLILSILLNGTTLAEDAKPPFLNWSVENIHADESVKIGKSGEVYVRGKGQQTLHAFDATGKELWQFKPTPTGSRLSAPSVAPDGTIYVILADSKERKSYLLALSPVEGFEMWRTLVFPRKVWVYWLDYIVAASDGTVFVATDYNAMALNPDGKVLWSYKFPAKIYTSPPTLSRDEKVLYVYRRSRGGIYALNLDGSLRWQRDVKYNSDSAPPAVGTNKDIYIADADTRSLYAYSPAGDIRWKKSFPDKTTGNTYPVVGADGTIYMQVSDPSRKGGEIVALDPKDGKLKWSFNIGQGFLDSSVLLSDNDRLYYVAGNGKVYCLNASTGKMVWEYDAAAKIGGKYRKRHFTSFPAISAGDLYIVSIEGKLLSIRVED
jgi:outer membrane protein assembly factor BamB